METANWNLSASPHVDLCSKEHVSFLVWRFVSTASEIGALASWNLSSYFQRVKSKLS